MGRTSSLKNCHHLPINQIIINRLYLAPPGKAKMSSKEVWAQPGKNNLIQREREGLASLGHPQCVLETHFLTSWKKQLSCAGAYLDYLSLKRTESGLWSGWTQILCWHSAHTIFCRALEAQAPFPICISQCPLPFSPEELPGFPTPLVSASSNLFPIFLEQAGRLHDGGQNRGPGCHKQVPTGRCGMG